jgi:mono/diheme cytochrome c family protein
MATCSWCSSMLAKATMKAIPAPTAAGSSKAGDQDAGVVGHCVGCHGREQDRPSSERFVTPDFSVSVSPTLAKAMGAALEMMRVSVLIRNGSIFPPVV